MDVLVVNCGSSSIKAAVVAAHTGDKHVTARIGRLNSDSADILVNDTRLGSQKFSNPAEALQHLLPLMLQALPADAHIEAVGHRVVHGGTRFTTPVVLDAAAQNEIAALAPLAPLHIPANLSGVDAARQVLPDARHIAVFDTAFHATLPRRSTTYAVDDELARKHGVRRYGFHGISHAYVARRAAEFLQSDLRDLRLVTCHLGNGCSVTAVEYGRSIETSMGMTPLEGLVMGTRSGDIGAGALLHLMREEGLDAAQMDELLNKSSGLKGLSGRGNDMREIEAGAEEGDERCRLAIQIFAHRLRKYIGAYAAVMGGVDAIVFTGGIGQNSALIRHRVAQRLAFLGARIDEDANRDARVDHRTPVRDFSSPHSRTRLLAVATDEAHEIAQQVALTVARRDQPADRQSIPVYISARHVHLTEETVETLFGTGHQLTVHKALSQPGQFAAKEKVTLTGPKRKLENVRIIGPTRARDQVEISRSDEFHLGLDAPVRGSGDLDNTPGITLCGPAGSVTITEGVICAWRHIHMTPEDAKRFGVNNKDIVDVAIESEGRDLVFGDVLVRVSPKYKLEMHVDTDEGNAAELIQGQAGTLFELAPTGRTGHLTRRSTAYDTA
ncbi:MAG: acetate/propionate family kinase [Gammaproteobacteria bacterium]